MGDLHIEATSEEAMIVRPNLYYMNDEYYRSCGISHNDIEMNGNYRRWFMNQL
jgi:hypothetical protein